MTPIRCRRAFGFAASLAVTGALWAQNQSDVGAAALRLKQGQVLRTLQECKSQGHPVKVCNELLELIHKRELQVIARLTPTAKDPTINQDELSRELAGCYSPNYDYPQLVECQNQLADRLAAARNGQFLLKR